MDVIIIKTKRGLPQDQLVAAYEGFGAVHFVDGFDNIDTMRGSLYLSHIPTPNDNEIESTSVKVQNVHAWNLIVQNNIPEALIVLDTVRVDKGFAINSKIPDGGDIGILSAPNLRMNGIHLNGTDWVFLDSDDPMFNNICNAYRITKNAASRLFARRNELLSENMNFAMYINYISNNMATDRITTYMSLNSTSSKPIHIL